MRSLTLVRVSPWPVALAVSIAASVLSALAAVEVRRGAAANRGMVAMMLCSFLTMLCMLELSPAMVTAVGGVGMVLIIALGVQDNPSPIQRISGVLMVGAVILIAVDIGMMGTPPEPLRASESSKGLFWSSVGISAVASVFAASKAHESTVCRMWLIVGTGVQMVASLGLAYVIMGGGQPGFLPLLIASALMEMYFVRMSLAVNALSASHVAIDGGIHLPVSYAVWQIGVWATSPCINEVQYHGTWLTLLGTVITMLCALSLVWSEIGPSCWVEVD